MSKIYDIQRMAAHEVTRPSTKQDEWRRAHKSVRITNEAYHVLIIWAGRLQAETGEVMGISEALIEVIRRVGAPDCNSSEEMRGVDS
jgi:hypothetical protein